MITIDPIKRPPKKSSTVDTTEIMKEVDLKFADLIDGAPDKLNTIKELAEAVANIPKIDNLATKKEIPTKLSLLNNDANYIQEDSLVNGVYAVTAADKLVDLEHADTSCVGVAVIATKTKFIIAKHDLGDSLQFYWGKNLKGLDIPNIENLSEDDSLDYTLGKNNTQAIISSYNALGVEMDNRDVSKSLQTLYENGDTNWYLPSTGLLVNMYTKFPKINEILSKIGGTLLTSDDAYWSSSECSDEEALVGLLRNGSVICSDYKDALYLVRLVRDLPEPKLVKERISTLETKVSELENKEIPAATIETVGGVKKFEIMDLQDKSNIDNLYKAYNTLVEQMVNAGVAEDTRFVDLGLPSGTLWATCNLGSDSIDDPGLFFLWGDIEGYYSRNGKVLDKYGNEVTKQFNNSNYKWIDSEGNIIKYFIDISDMSNPILDTRLHEEDNVILLTNPNWAYPLWELMDELVEYTRRYDVDINGAKLLCLESINNGNKLYFPYVTPLGNNYGSNYPMFLYNYASTMPGSDQTSVYTFTTGEPFKPNGTLSYSFMRSSALPIRYVKNP